MSIVVGEVSMAFGPQVLFENVNVSFNPGERYGLTGPNGSGKSTFMKIVTGDLEASTGHVRKPKKYGVLRQDHYAFDGNRIIDVVMMGNKKLWKTMVEKEKLLEKGDDLSDDEGMRLAELEMVIAEEDGYMAEPEAAELLEGLGIEEKAHTELLDTLTGGDKVRVLLAQSLFGKPDALLLDEPTNALDIASIRWLEGFMKSYTGVLVVISHDRHFLNAVCTKIADIDYETIIVYPGNYDDMVEAKAGARSALEGVNQAKQKRIADLQEFVQRFRAGSRASQVKSRSKQLDRERQALANLKRSNIARPFMRFEIARPSGKQVLQTLNRKEAYRSPMLYLRKHWRGQDPASPFGQAFECAITDTVTRADGEPGGGADIVGSHEYLVFFNVIQALAKEAGLEVVKHYPARAGRGDTSSLFQDSDADSGFKRFKAPFGRNEGDTEVAKSLRVASELYVAAVFRKQEAKEEGKGEKEKEEKEGEGDEAEEPERKRARTQSHI